MKQKLYIVKARASVMEKEILKLKKKVYELLSLMTIQSEQIKMILHVRSEDDSE